MTVQRVVLINKSSAAISFAEVSAVAQALQTQIDRDFVPVWGIRAQIMALKPTDKIPAGVWPMRIVNKPVGGLGIHLDTNHKPFAQIKDTADWSVTASHELLEMLVDPLGQKFIKAPDISPASDGHLVSYLVEVGDPCEVFTYNINNVAVSDFVTPDYYNANAAAGTTLDFLTRLSQPLEVPSGCYISWIDPSDEHWHQKTPDGTFNRSARPVDSHKNPRDDRDVKLPESDQDRHDLSRIRAAFDV